MGFYDNPVSDEASKNSEESELALRQIFTKRNGFICRPVNPDTGSDFLVELLLKETEVSNWHFGIQLKSDENIEVVEEGKEISYTLKTSRLGYLSRHIPGLIVLYHVKQGLFYYNYVSEVVARLYHDKGTDWEKQNWGNIRIPISNILNGETVHQIHAEYSRLFDRITRMQHAQGGKYGVPCPTIKIAEDDYDFNSAESIIKFLLKFGTSLLIEYDLQVVSDLIEKLTERQIASETKIMCIAAAVYSESGKYELSELYCKKALRRKDISEGDAVIVLFASTKNRFRLGAIQIEEGMREIEELKNRKLSEQSALTIAVNVIQFRLSLIRLDDEVPDSFRDDILSLFEAIQESSLSRKVKIVLILWNADNFSWFINLFFRSIGKQIALSDSDTLKIKLLRAITHLDQQLFNLLDVGRPTDVDFNPRLIQGYALQIRVNHIVQREIFSIGINPNLNSFRGFESQLPIYVNFALTAHRFLLEEGDFRGAYLSLCYGLELIELGRLRLGLHFDLDIEGLYALKEAMEEEMGADKYVVVMPGVLKAAGVAQEGYRQDELTDEQFARLRSLIALLKELPDELGPNLVKEVNSLQAFFRRCKDPNVDLVSVYGREGNLLQRYASPVRYALVQKSANIRSTVHVEIDDLLKNWGY